MSVISCLHQNLLTVNYSTRQMPGSGDDITTDSDIIRRSHGIKTDSSEMRWLGRGRLNVTQERKRSMRVNLWLWQLLPADAAPPPPLHPATPGPAYTRQEPGQMKAVSLSLSLSVKKMWQVLTSDDSVMYRHQKADVFIMRSQRGLGWVKQYAHTSLLPPHELNPFILSWINPSCYLALRHGIICHKVYFCVNFCTCAKTFFW